MAIAADASQSIPIPRKLPRDERRAQLIEATISTMGKHGYARTTMSEVARVAGLSHGLVNFHFESKENLLLETLLHLAEEYRLNWTAALAGAGPNAAAQINAMLLADFDPRICTQDRLSAWCSFWGEAQSRPIYQERCGSNDQIYTDTLDALCARMIAEHGYTGNPTRIGRVFRVIVEGVWLDMMTLREPYPLQEARATVMTTVAAFFPRHFNENGLITP
ncbi:TetR/AcrR family transcriptional regulator [Tabrizicola sp.]|uniref:TetR/AcrR family transcriptional regulator n=1 Tax=Tabrizicola sp. TaxID=2005166 RepID=UPI00286C52D3|nr:TetR/AcrR family transcriptional regulator [Tabrizicola sp.]